jgi:hypothetical protein
MVRHETLPRDEMLTICPPPPWIMCCTAHQVTFAAPTRLTASVSVQARLPVLVGGLGDRMWRLKDTGVVDQHV